MLEYVLSNVSCYYRDQMAKYWKLILSSLGRGFKTRTKGDTQLIVVADYLSRSLLNTVLDCQCCFGRVPNGSGCVARSTFSVRHDTHLTETKCYGA